ncbi:MAG: hypothetical protein GC134_07510 [Proteobacteria bacterium]|nr:hypothetical protein [Pseudomonadota bacterium]
MADKQSKKTGQKPWYALSTREWVMGGVGIALGTVAFMPMLAHRDGHKGLMIRELSDDGSSGVVSRTEIGRKEPATIIEVLDGMEAATSETAVEPATPVTMPKLADADLRNLKTVLENLDAERAELIGSLKELSQATLGESARMQQVVTLVNTLQSKVVEQEQQIEALKSQNTNAFGDKVKDLGLIFLGQQLVVLDNAYTRGDATQPAVKNVADFARNVANQPMIAEKMDALAKLAEVGVITRLSLLEQMDAVLADGAPVAKVPTPQNAHGSLWDRLKERANQWVKVRKIDTDAPTVGDWAALLTDARRALANGQDGKAKELLAEELLAQDERLDALRAHVDGYLEQKGLLQEAQNAYYAAYRP